MKKENQKPESFDPESIDYVLVHLSTDEWHLCEANCLYCKNQMPISSKF